MLLSSLLSAIAGGVTTALVLRTRRARHATGYPARIVEMPHPQWMPGQKQPAPFAGDHWTAYDPSKVEKAAVYPLVISVFVPRPIALISSCDKDGNNINLSPYSYFNAMGHDPVVFCVGINRSPGRGGGKKDTLQNIEEAGEFVVNIMSDWFVESANHSCGDFERGINELQLTGLTSMPSMLVRPPRVKESAVHMECRLRQIVDINGANNKPSSAIVIGEVVMFHIHEAVQARSPTGKLVVDPVKLEPICRLGGTTYGRVTELFDIGRPGQAQMHMGPAQYTASYNKHPNKVANTQEPLAAKRRKEV